MAMNAQNWDEPWAQRQLQPVVGLFTANGSCVYTTHDTELARSQIARIVACVNAMAGKDPAALVEIEGELLDIVWTVINDYGHELDESLLARARAAVEGHGKVLLRTEDGE